MGTKRKEVMNFIRILGRDWSRPFVGLLRKMVEELLKSLLGDYTRMEILSSV